MKLPAQTFTHNVYVQTVVGDIVTIEPCPLLLKDLKTAEKLYNLCINLWSNRQKSTTDRTRVHKLLKQGNSNNATVIDLHYEASGGIVYIQNKPKYFANYFKCPNYDAGCRMKFARRRHINDHIKNCKTLEEHRENPHIVQLALDNTEHPLSLALDEGWIQDYPQNVNFIVFDLECSLTSIDKLLSSNLSLHQRHDLLSIAANAYINGSHESMVWVIDESTEEARYKIVEEFLKFCHKMLNKMNIDSKLKIAYEQLKIEWSQTKFYRKKRRSKLASQVYELRNVLSLPIYGYNSSRYDSKVLCKYLFQAATNLNVSLYSSDSRTVTKKCQKSPGIFSVLVVFLGVFFRKFAKNRKKIPKCNSPGVKVRE